MQLDQQRQATNQSNTGSQASSTLMQAPSATTASNTGGRLQLSRQTHNQDRPGGSGGGGGGGGGSGNGSAAVVVVPDKSNEGRDGVGEGGSDNEGISKRMRPMES